MQLVKKRYVVASLVLTILIACVAYLEIANRPVAMRAAKEFVAMHMVFELKYLMDKDEVKKGRKLDPNFAQHVRVGENVFSAIEEDVRYFPVHLWPLRTCISGLHSKYRSAFILLRDGNMSLVDEAIVRLRDWQQELERCKVIAQAMPESTLASAPPTRLSGMLKPLEQENAKPESRAVGVQAQPPKKSDTGVTALKAVACPDSLLSQRKPIDRSGYNLSYPTDFVDAFFTVSKGKDLGHFRDPFNQNGYVTTGDKVKCVNWNGRDYMVERLFEPHRAFNVLFMAYDLQAKTMMVANGEDLPDDEVPGVYLGGKRDEIVGLFTACEDNFSVCYHQ